MRIRVLGPLELEGFHNELAPRDRVVLSALLTRHGDPLSADQLADALWGEGPPASWLKVIHGCVSRLRRVLGTTGIETVPAGYRLRPDAIDLDVVEFEELVRRGRQYAASGSPERAAALFVHALGLWRGRPFDELEEWTPGRLEATRLGELRLAVEEDLLQARLDQGEHRDVAAEALVATGEEPWRERRWALLALAQYRSGRQADALASIRRARRALGHELGLDPGSELVELERAILAQDSSLAAEHEARAASADCPWKGLSPYSTHDQDAFFGRSTEVAAALKRLDAHPLLVLTGPSGSGKSSLMLAGLAPALQRRGLQVASFTPGSDPTVAMGTALAGVRGDPVLLIDQFEEAFTLAGPEGAMRPWLAELATYAQTRAPVVITLRADHVAHLAIEPAFARLAEQGVHLVAPLEGDALRQAIEEPARLAGLRLEQGLVELMVRDTEGQPGALPLLSHALVETWRRRESGLLTVEGYRASGGLRGAVAASAERLYEGLSETERRLLRRLTLRMVSMTDGGEPVRMALPFAVAAGDPARRRLLDRLVRARLVTTDAESFELAHEALARAWPRLRAWLDEDAGTQRMVGHLAAAAAGWEALGRPDSELYRGARLQSALEWRSRDDADPTELEGEFLDAAESRVHDALLLAARQARRERQQNRRLRLLLGGVAVLLLVSATIGAVAVDRGRVAAHDRDSAEAATSDAQHESLVGRSLTLRATKRAAAALLAIEAYRAEPDALSESALLGTFTEAPGFLGYREVPYYVVQGAAIPGTQSAVMASGTRVHVVDLVTGDLGPLFDHPVRSDKSLISVLHVSADASRVAQLMFDPGGLDHCGSFEVLEEDNGRGCTLLTVFDVATGDRVMGPVSTPFSGGDVAIDRTGALVAVTGGLNGDLATYDVASGRLLGRLAGLPRPPEANSVRDTGAVRFDDDGDVFLGSMRGPVREVDASSLRVLRTLPAPARSTHNFLELTKGGLLVGAGDGGMVAFDADSGSERWRIDLSEKPDLWPCNSFAVAEDMDRVYCGGSFGAIEERDLRSGQLTGLRLDSQLGEVGALTVSGGNELVEFSRGYYYQWRLDGSGPISRLTYPGKMSIPGYDPSGRYLALSPRGEYSDHEIVDVRSGNRVALDKDGDMAWVGPGILAVGDGKGNHFVDAATGRQWRPAAEELALAERIFSGRDGKLAWATLVRPEPAEGTVETYDVRQFEVATGKLTGVEFSVDGYPYLVADASDSDSVWVNYYGGSGSWLSYEDELNNKGIVVDLETGEHSQPTLVASSAISGVDGLGRLVGADYQGEIRELDPVTLEPIATVPGSRGQVVGLAFSADGERLVAPGGEGSVQVFDTEEWTRLGAIPSDSLYAQQGWLRPDGNVVAVNGRLGVAEWTLVPDELAAAACRVAGRNLTATEWATYMGDEPYRRTCEEFPAGN